MFEGHPELGSRGSSRDMRRLGRSGSGSGSGAGSLGLVGRPPMGSRGSDGGDYGLGMGGGMAPGRASSPLSPTSGFRHSMGSMSSTEGPIAARPYAPDGDGAGVASASPKRTQLRGTAGDDGAIDGGLSDAGMGAHPRIFTQQAGPIAAGPSTDVTSPTVSPSPWATGSEDERTNSAGGRRSGGGRGDSGPVGSDMESFGGGSADDGVAYEGGEYGETDGGDRRDARVDDLARAAAHEAAALAAHALDEACKAASALAPDLKDAAEDSRLDDATRATRVCDACDAMWPHVDQLCSGLTGVYDDPAVRSVDTIVAPYASALGARRRLLRAAIQSMDSASGVALIKLARIALRLASAPGPVAVPERGGAAGLLVQLAAPPAPALLSATLHSCRLLFSASKDDTLDSAFREQGMLRMLLALMPVAPPQERGRAPGQGSESKGGEASEAKILDDGSSAPSAGGASGTTGLRSAASSVAGDADNPASWRPVDELVYTAGVLKNISGLSSENQAWLVRQGAVRVLVGVVRGALLAGSNASSRPPSGGASSVSSGGDGSGSERGSHPRGGKGPSQQQAAQLLVQVTGCLRNLCLSKRHFKPFWDSGAVDALLGLLPVFTRHAELMLNVTRILSKLSLQDGCRSRFTKRPVHLKNLLRLLAVHPTHKTLLVRVCFVLGNLTSSNDTNRVRTAVAYGAVPALLKLISYFTTKLRKAAESKAAEAETGGGGAAGDGSDGERAGGGGKRTESGGDAGDGASTGRADSGGDGDGGGKSSDGGSGTKRKEGSGGRKGKGSAEQQLREVDEVLVKAVRVLANLAINVDVGARLCVTPGIERLVDLLEVVDVADHEELVLNVVSAVTNLTYYSRAIVDGGGAVQPLTAAADDTTGPIGTALEGEAVDLISANQLRIVRHLVPLLLHDHEEAVVEAARAFGNFSRDAEVRRLMLDMRAVDALVILLDHSNRELVFTAVGVLMNVVMDEEGKDTLRRAEVGGIEKLDAVIRQAWLEHDDVTALALKTLYNYLLGWKGTASNRGGDGAEAASESKADLMSSKPRLSAEQCVALLQTLNELIEDGEEAAETETDAEGEGGRAEAYLGCVALAVKVRDCVKEIVHTGAVAVVAAPASP